MCTTPCESKILVYMNQRVSTPQSVSPTSGPHPQLGDPRSVLTLQPGMDHSGCGEGQKLNSLPRVAPLGRGAHIARPFCFRARNTTAASSRDGEGDVAISNVLRPLSQPPDSQPPRRASISSRTPASLTSATLTTHHHPPPPPPLLSSTRAVNWLQGGESRTRATVGSDWSTAIFSSCCSLKLPGP